MATTTTTTASAFTPTTTTITLAPQQQQRQRSLDNDSSGRRRHSSMTRIANHRHHHHLHDDSDIAASTSTTTATTMMNRRSLLWTTVGLIATAATVTTSVAAEAEVSSPTTSLLVDEQQQESLYFGVGCFWHIQHEFVEQGERQLLGRNDRELTSLTGYAGGTRTDSFSRVCYHNFQQVADYGKMGHGEVVGMRIPTNQILNFTTLYFSLFNPKTLDRVDPMDRGAEYRSLIGLVGGTNHILYPEMQRIAENAGFQLVEGQGNDPDTLGKQIVYVYDTTTFPFYQAELYHQYHNDFQSPPYGSSYNRLADLAFAEGRIQITGCPDKV